MAPALRMQLFEMKTSRDAVVGHYKACLPNIHYYSYDNVLLEALGKLRALSDAKKVCQQALKKYPRNEDLLDWQESLEEGYNAMEKALRVDRGMGPKQITICRWAQFSWSLIHGSLQKCQTTARRSSRKLTKTWRKYLTAYLRSGSRLSRHEIRAPLTSLVSASLRNATSRLGRRYSALELYLGFPVNKCATSAIIATHRCPRL